MGIKDLFTPDFKSENPETRLRALAKLDDQALLAELAKTDSSPRVRMAAVEKVTDQEKLVGIALDGNEIDARIAAVGKIDSQEKLAEIIRVRKNFKLTGACFERITDKDLLNRIANDPEYNRTARRIAIENFADEAYLAETADETPDKKVKSPEEIDAIIDKYGGMKLLRVMGKFRGSKNSILVLGEILRRGGDAAPLALEYLAQTLNYSNPEISRTAADILAGIKDPELISGLIAMIGKSDLDEKIMKVLNRIDHPDARDFVNKT